MIGLLTSRLGLSTLFAIAIYAVWQVGTNSLNDALADASAQRTKATQSETLRNQCNMEVAGLNAHLATQAAISELEQIERDKLLENVDEERQARLSLTEQARARTRQIQRSFDCAAEPLHPGLISLSDTARDAANKHPSRGDDL